MALSGFAPDLDGCAECGAVDSPYMLLDLAGGTLRCEKCVERAIREDINQSLISRTEEEAQRRCRVVLALAGAARTAALYRGGTDKTLSFI